MPFLVPLIGAIAPTVGSALIGAGVSVALGFVAQQLQPKPKKPQAVDPTQGFTGGEQPRGFIRQLAGGPFPISSIAVGQHLRDGLADCLQRKLTDDVVALLIQVEIDVVGDESLERIKR